MCRISTRCTVGVTLVVAALLNVTLVGSVSTSTADENDESPFVGTPPGWDKKPSAGIGLAPTGKPKQPGKKDGKFHLVEATIADIHGALRSEEHTSELQSQ